MDDLNMIDRGCCKGHVGNCSKMNVYDWLSDVNNISNPTDLVEVRFKNTRKDYFRNVNNLKLDPGEKQNVVKEYPDVVARLKGKLLEWDASIEAQKVKYRVSDKRLIIPYP